MNYSSGIAIAMVRWKHNLLERTMGFLFRKRIKILPGIWLNLSKHGANTSFSGKGLAANIKDGRIGTSARINGGPSYGTITRSLYKAAPRRGSLWKWVLLAVLAGTALLVLQR